VAAVERADEGFGTALDSIAAGLAAPFAGREVAGQFGLAQALEGDDGNAEAVTSLAGRIDDRDSGEDAVAAAGEQFQAGACFGFSFGLGQDAAAGGDDGVGGEDDPAGVARGGGFLRGDAAGVIGGQLGLARRLVDVGGDDFVGDDTEPPEQLKAARAGRGEDEAGAGQGRALI